MRVAAVAHPAPAAPSHRGAFSLQLPYPPTARCPIVETKFGWRVRDTFRWLEDAKNPHVQAWMTAQDQLARGVLNLLPGRNALTARFRELLYRDTCSAPTRRGDRHFFFEKAAEREMAVLTWEPVGGGERRVLLDPQSLSPDGTTAVGTTSLSPDGAYLAYTVKPNNSDEATLHLRTVDTAADSAVDVIPGTKYASPSWTADARGFYYTWLPTDPTIPTDQRPGFAEIRYHQLGTNPESDPVIFARTGDPQKFVSAALIGSDRRFLVVTVGNWDTQDIYLRDLHNPDASFTTFIEGMKGEVDLQQWGKHLYLYTNVRDSRGEVIRIPVTDPEHGDWTQLIAPTEDGILQGMDNIGGRLVLYYQRDGYSQIEVRTLDGEKRYDVELPAVGTASHLIGREEDDEAYFAFDSLVHAPAIHTLAISSGKTSVWRQQPFPADLSRFAMERVWVTSKDGTEVPMFVVGRKDLPRDGTAPTLLYGYGGFANGLEPDFNAGIIPWLEAGGRYAMAQIRGGDEFGKAWHDAGKLEHKQNVFDDFIAAAEFLIGEGYTNSARLAINGGSNGGLLVGAAMTQRPELFGVVVCAVPLLDMLRYHLFGSGRTWMSEYGNPDQEPDFHWLHAYSPQHNIVAGTPYPALLVLSADADDRVDPMHARKFVAAIQAASGSGAPALLRIAKNAGHGGGAQLRSRVETLTDTYAFLMHQFGMQVFG